MSNESFIDDAMIKMIYKIFNLKKGIGIEWSADRQIVHWWKNNTNKWRSKGMQAQTGISYPMHTTEIPILTSGSK